MGLRFFEKTADVSIAVGFHQTVGAGILDGRQDDGGAGAPLTMKSNDGRQIELGQYIAVEHQDGLVQILLGVLHSTGRSQRHRLDDVADRHAQLPAVADQVFDPAGLIVQAEDDLVNLRNLPEEVDLIAEKRTVEDRHDRLRRIERERAKARTLPAGEEDRLHRRPRRIRR